MSFMIIVRQSMLLLQVRAASTTWQSSCKTGALSTTGRRAGSGLVKRHDCGVGKAGLQPGALLAFLVRWHYKDIAVLNVHFRMMQMCTYTGSSTNTDSG